MKELAASLIVDQSTGRAFLGSLGSWSSCILLPASRFLLPCLADEARNLKVAKVTFAHLSSRSSAIIGRVEASVCHYICTNQIPSLVSDAN